jgi:putative membrane protein
MKKYLKFTLLFIFALITENQIWHNLTFDSIPLSVIKVALILAFFELVLKPIIKILLLPINFLTLGLIRIVIDTIGLYLATFFLTDFHLDDIFMVSTNFFGFNIPQFHFIGFFGYLVSSFTLGFLIYIFKLILNKKEVKK